MRKSTSSKQAQYFTTKFPRSVAGTRVEYEVLVRLSGTRGATEQRVGETCWFEVVAKNVDRGVKPRTRLAENTPVTPHIDSAEPEKTVHPDLDARTLDQDSDATHALTDSVSVDNEEPGDASIASKNPADLLMLDARNKKRLDCLKRCQSGRKANEKLEDLFRKAEGDIPQFKKLLEESAGFDEAAIRQLDFANDLVDLTEEDEALVDVFLSHNKTNCLRDVALNLKKEEFKSIIGKTAKAEDKEKKASELHDRLFRMAPAAVIHRMARDNELEAEGSVKKGLIDFFEAHPDLDFRKDSILNVLKQPEEIEKIPESCRDKVIHSLKCCQRLAAICPNAEALPKLMKVGLDSAHAINEVPYERFVTLYADILGGEEVAKRVHNQAQNISVRNEHALIALRDAVLSPSVNMVHGGQSVDTRRAAAIQIAEQNNIPINFETLFGSVDLCECKHCNSVYSPAAYLVELFQYLRNNNLVPRKEPPNPEEPLSQFTGKAGIKNTPLDKLFRRRPDLFHLQLTCENTHTLIPYIDLVNEVMESFVVYLNYFEQNSQKPKQAKIAVHNVDDESSGELLAEAQHTDYRAYEILSKVVYPACKLPYHLPIDATRQYLNFLKTSRYELFNTFRADVSFEPEANASDEEKERLARKEVLEIQAVDRAIAAEYLHLTEEEYVILTKKGFHTKEWVELDQQIDLTKVQYHNEIGLKKTWDYYGIGSENQMLAELKWVKPAQESGMVGFLRRVNLQYVDLIEILKTRYINPNYLSGQALAFMNCIPYSYRYLQSLVDKTQTDIKLKYQQVVELLLESNLVTCNDLYFSKSFKTCWVYKYFEKIGKLIVLENASSCECIEGTIHLFGFDVGSQYDHGTIKELSINSNCQIYQKKFDSLEKVGYLDTSSGKLIFYQDFLNNFSPIGKGDFLGKNGETGHINDFFLIIGRQLIICTDYQETCDISKTQLKHLDGTDLVTAEYDRLHRFIRLWCKLDWSIAEVDQAITGIGETVNNPSTGMFNYTANKDFKAFGPPLPPKEIAADIVSDKLLVKLSVDDSNSLNDRIVLRLPGTHPDPGPSGPPRDPVKGIQPTIDLEKDCKPEPISQVLQEITPYLIEQLVAVKKLQKITGLELPKLLVYWTSIGTQGENSLYEQLFLKYNLIAVDKIFKKAAENSTYLATDPDAGYFPPPISNHQPALMAALKVDSAMLEKIMAYAGIADKLTLANISHIYRHVLLAKTFRLRVKQLPALVDLIKDQVHPFSQPTNTLRFYQFFERIDNSGFDIRELNYIIRNEDDQERPVHPETGDVFHLAIDLRNALLQIEADHANIKNDEEATEELLRDKLSLLYDDAIVEQIIHLMQGTTVYADNTRRKYSATLGENACDEITSFFREERKKDEQTLEDGDFHTFLQKVQFSSERGLQVTGILSDSDKGRLCELASEITNENDRDKFLIAVNKLLAQAKIFFDNALAPIFPEQAGEDENFLLTEDTVDSEGGEVSAIQKRACLLREFLPYLREQLRQRQVVQILSSELGLDQDLTEKLVMEIIKTADGEVLYEEIVRLKQQKDPAAENQDKPLIWDGFFVPEQDGRYLFLLEAIKKDEEATLTFNNQSMWSCPYRTDEEEINFYRSEKAVFLKAGQTYPFRLQGYDEDESGKQIGLFMKFNDKPQTEISDKNLFPALRTEAFKEAYIRLHKAAILLNGFGVKLAEFEFFLKFHAGPEELDSDTLSFSQWLRLEAFYRLHKSLPVKELSLIEFLRWSNLTQDTESEPSLAAQISRLTGWEETDVCKLIKPENFNLWHPQHFRDERNLLKLQETLKVAKKIGADIHLLFQWGAPTSDFESSRIIADDIRQVIRARFTQEEWEEAIKPVHDQLRENQKQALIAYLLAQPALLAWGVRDADSLFEFFLIDVQMDACMETSRIKQAISSVQLFVQRCFLGLEEKHDVSSEILDRQRWEWMSRYRVWEANRKVFLYPENWIRPELRDVKTPFFQELESELLQNDVSQDAVKSALTKYIVQVDEVANLEVVGQFIEGEDDSRKLHVIGRTRNAPYFFYYRYYEYKYKYWYPWEKIEVDIPIVDIEDNNGMSEKIGAFVMPVVWLDRLFIFFPQFMRKNWDSPLKKKSLISNNAEASMGSNEPLSFWEIKMGWSEYKEGKWTPKQISSQAICSLVGFSEEEPNLIGDGKAGISEAKTVIEENNFILLIERDKWIFSPFVQADKIYIQPYYLGNTLEVTEKLGRPGLLQEYIEKCREEEECREVTKKRISEETWFTRSLHSNLSRTLFSESFRFDGNQITKVDVQVIDLLPKFWASHYTGFHHFAVIYLQSWLTPIHQPIDDDNLLQNASVFPRFVEENNDNTLVLNLSERYSVQHTRTRKLLGYLRIDRLKNVFNNDNKNGIKLNNDNYGSNDSIQYHELIRPYAIYNWEALFHSVALLADNLSKSQRFEEAMTWWHYIFDPINGKGDIMKVWKFLPFRATDSKNILEKIFSNLKPNTPDPDGKITEWRDKPFQPHVIARDRPSAYMKWVVMKYIDNLIDWGDSLFRQDTIESINQATQLYILAGHILGPRPEFIPKRGKIQPKSYLDLVNKWDAFSNTIVDLELIFPFSNQIATPVIPDEESHYINIYGFATALYFCIPDNPKLLEYWDTVADRLFKIRHCLNIEGIFRKLNLFEPPIDPALLVQAAAQGLSIGSVLNDLSTPMPNYRFNYLLARALEVTSEVKSLGNALLSALEKKDGESLSLLRAKHDTNIQTLVMEVRKKQLEEAEKTKESLVENRKAPVYRLEHYQQLAGEEASVPDEGAEFTLIANNLPEVKEESGMKLIGEEAEEIKKAKLSRDLQIGVGVMETLAGILALIPGIDIDVKPIGVGAGTETGGLFLSAAGRAVASSVQIGVNITSAKSAAASRKAGYKRQLIDRVFQANIAGQEIKQIDKQITTQEIRCQLACKEIENHQVQIDQTKEVEEFMRSKFSNEQLYHWMSDQLKNLYYQTYSFAYDLAKKAEKVYRFDMGFSTSDFVKFGYWNSGKEGFLAGEQLYLALKQLENAYIETKSHDYEITKHISLRQVNPLALIQLKEQGVCEFNLAEELFDLDYPGQYKRRIKTVAVSIPCIVGPHTSLNCTLRLLKHEYRNSKIAANYAKNLEEADERFITNPIPTTAISVSHGQNDSGVFELSFQSERYLPFEGAGAISSWRLELPQKFRQFDYQTITDVVVHLRYTSSEGGDIMKTAALGHLDEFVSSAEELSKTEGLFRMFSLPHEFPNEWHRLFNPEPGTENQQILHLGNLKERFPFFAQSQQIKSVSIVEIRLFTPTPAESTAEDLQISILRSDQIETLADNLVENFSGGAEVGNFKQYVITDLLADLTGLWGVQFGQNQEVFTKDQLSNAWMVVKYQLEMKRHED
ncbi:MAG TPA: neuraminidase-like domain-containing protein [Nitrosomonas nitrosa]|nr:neuraminidase-like domain-containing protein [Nitrosomonas nitrosa]